MCDQGQSSGGLHREAPDDRLILGLSLAEGQPPVAGDLLAAGAGRGQEGYEQVIRRFPV